MLLPHGTTTRERRTNDDLVRSLKRHSNITWCDIQPISRLILSASAFPRLVFLESLSGTRYC